MNLFRIDFYQGKTDEPDYGQVKHSLVDGTNQRAIISLSVSADKLQSVSNYTREPKRLVFECFLTDWIRDNILSGEHEHERYISHYEIKAYRDNELFFTGIIDTSQLSQDISTNIIKITCYDKLKLLSVYSDLECWYSSIPGSEPWDILVTYLLHIRLRIPIRTPAASRFMLPVRDNALTVCTIDYSDMYALPALSYVSLTIHENTWYQPKYGYRFTLNDIHFMFLHKVVIHADYGTGGDGYYQCRLRGRIVRIFNGICPVVQEYDSQTGWDTLEAVDNMDGLISFFTDKGIAESTLDELISGDTIHGRTYDSNQTPDHQVVATFSGNIYPSYLQPGQAYINYTSEHTGMMKVLRAMLMLYNATLYTDAQGRIILANKGAYSNNIIDIEDRDVVSFVLKRTSQEEPKVSELDVLAGDTTQLQEIIKGELMGFYESRWSIDAVIDQLAKYDLALQSKIRIRDQVYAITELAQDYEKDEYKVKAWRIT
jgi:hypothetical protein